MSILDLLVIVFLTHVIATLLRNEPLSNKK
jgi:hypothetical protein